MPEELKEEIKEEEKQEQHHEEEVEAAEQKEKGVQESEKKEEELKAKEPEKKEEVETPWYQSDGFTFKTEEDAIKSMKELRGTYTRTSQELAAKERMNDVYQKFIHGELTLDEGQTLESYMAEDQKKFITEQEENRKKIQRESELITQAIEVGKKLYPKIVTNENMDVLNALAFHSKKVTPLERLQDAVQLFEDRFGHLSKQEKEKIRDHQENMKEEANLEDAGSKGKKKTKEMGSAWDKSTEEFNKDMQNLRYNQQ